MSISPDRPFKIVAADITELPLSTRGNRYVLVMMDLYTKFVNLYPLKDQTAISWQFASLIIIYRNMEFRMPCIPIKADNSNQTSLKTSVS